MRVTLPIRYVHLHRQKFSVLAILTVFITGQAEAGDAANGKRISEEHCSRCHVVGDFNPTGGISSTPSFQLLVKRRPDYRERFQSFHVRRPHPAVVQMEGTDKLVPELPYNAAPIKLPMEAIDDIVAFAETLEPKD